MVNLDYQTIALAGGFGQGQGAGNVTGAALRLYRRSRAAGWWFRLWAQLTGHPHELRTALPVQVGHARGTQNVPLDRVVGSEGRMGDFDAGFHPLRDEGRSRWMGVAAARLRQVPLPRVQLLQVGDEYYVRDGHHRISVARALGEEFIEAEVVG